MNKTASSIVVYRTRKPWFKTYFLYPLELLGVLIFCLFFRIFPLDIASGLGGFLGRHIGIRHKVSWVARYNLVKIFPNKTPAEIDEIVLKMWDNIGRTFAEYPHLRSLSVHFENRIEFVNLERAEKIRDTANGGILFSAHIGNWEISSILGNRLGINLNRFYRAANNPLVEWLFRFYRQKIGGDLFPKGTAGMRRLLPLMAKKEYLALLIDQKMNDGIEADFFGFPAMTTPALARLALKYNCPVLPIRSQRLKGAHYRLVIEHPLSVPKTNDLAQDVLNLTTQANQVLENWIKDDPAQWFLVHKRFADSGIGATTLYTHRDLWYKGIKPTFS